MQIDKTDLGLMLYHFCHALADTVEVEAMKVANLERLDRGYSVAYPEESFLHVTNSLRGHAEACRELGMR